MATRQYGAPARVKRALLAAAPILPALERIEIVTRMARAEGVPLQLRRMTMLSQASRGGSRSCNLGETACSRSGEKLSALLSKKPHGYSAEERLGHVFPPCANEKAFGCNLGSSGSLLKHARCDGSLQVTVTFNVPTTPAPAELIEYHRHWQLCLLCSTLVCRLHEELELRVSSTEHSVCTEWGMFSSRAPEGTGRIATLLSW